mmetsp:Transcript_12886/g.16472  ORF Transcript_12886/g.16472 Transcript_12886/m.16472 type:complete len:108 (+) Transcript_12886:294-617(+)
MGFTTRGLRFVVPVLAVRVVVVGVQICLEGAVSVARGQSAIVVLLVICHLVQLACSVDLRLWLLMVREAYETSLKTSYVSSSYKSEEACVALHKVTNSAIFSDWGRR